MTVGLEVVEATPVRLDESPDGPPLPVAGRTLSLAVPPHALRSVRLVCRS
jgi:hypothetical protein